MQVGVRELKAHLSEYIAKAREGESVVVTDRGKPVVRLEPIRLRPGHDKLPAKMRALIESGQMIDKGPPKGKLPKPLPPLKGDKTLSDLIIEERDESVRRYEWARDYRSQ